MILNKRNFLPSVIKEKRKNSWYSSKKERVKAICFGIESAGNTSKDVAQGINHSLNLFEYNNDGIQLDLDSSTTDTGGRGTNISLIKAFEEVERAVHTCNYNWVNCTLHAMNLMLQ